MASWDVKLKDEFTAIKGKIFTSYPQLAHHVSPSSPWLILFFPALVRNCSFRSSLTSTTRCLPG